ncbi:peroxidase 29 [Silene latifolia]|uniref:peroxidase 29 n=1 Tax=Silene latifolia TaxID=37657 RepID=UPI003D776182
MGSSTILLIFTILITFSFSGATKPKPKGLSFSFYNKTCPPLEDIVRDALAPVFSEDPTSPAALLRLMFHDCQVQGCDASILIDLSNVPSLMPSEIGASKNFGIRKRESINMVKSVVESVCPRQVSCADLIVLAAREAVAVSGGPKIHVPLGRRDSTSTLGSEAADASLPSADIGVHEALRLFAKLGMNTEEAVAIMGSHTLGVTHCLNIMNRLYMPHGKKSSKMDPDFEVALKVICPESITAFQNASFVFNDPTTFRFDNRYYKNSIAGRGILKIDTELAFNPTTAPFVQQFAAYREDFFQAFGSAFVKLSYAGVLTGNNGIIRSMCNSVNF